ncbi:hypothetical protein SGCOL_002664 [Colletotrichum sp. CLE4]
MCVEVEGRLKSKMQQTRHGMKFLRFRSKSKDTDNSTAIEIDLSSAASVFKNQLDGVAGRLNEDMKTEMDDARAVEMPLPMPAALKEADRFADLSSEDFDDVGDLGVVDLVQFATSEIIRQSSPAKNGSESSTGGETLVSDNSDQGISDKPVRSVGRVTAQNVFKVSEAMALALFSWVMMVVKLMGSSQQLQLTVTPTFTKKAGSSPDHGKYRTPIRNSWDVGIDEHFKKPTQYLLRPKPTATISDGHPQMMASLLNESKIPERIQVQRRGSI